MSILMVILTYNHFLLNIVSNILDLQSNTLYICYGEKMKRDTTIIIRIEKQAKKELQKLAESDRRSLADFIRLKLESIVDESKKK